MRIIPVFILFSVLLVDLKAIDLSGVNFDYRYDPDAQVKFAYRLMQKEGLFRLQFTLEYDLKNYDKLGTQLYLQKDYTDTIEVNLQDSLTSSTQLDSSLDYVFDFTADSTYLLAVVEVIDSLRARTYYFDLTLNPTVDFPSPGFYPILSDGSLLYRPYLDERSEIAFTDSLITGYKYAQEFSAAIPPMSTAKSNSRKLNIEEVIAVGDSFDLERGKFYFFQKDTSGFSGVGLLATTPLYPKLISLEEIIQPLIYISTSKEYNEISNSDQKKKAMDKYFLDITGDRERALKLIRRYFKRIRAANELFTTYKEGWKTDRGMVYIVMGKPSNVSRSMVQERWTYRASGSNEMVFIFDRVKNIFTQNHYTLRRSEDFSKDWFRQVDLWRKGRM